MSTKILLNFVVVCCFIVCCTSQDPCDPAQHSVINEDFERSSGHPVSNPPKSDRYIDAGWYRFKGAQGEDMVTSSPGLQKCGTTFPIWLDGTIPSEGEGIVPREACVVGFGDDCTHRYNIQIKNCGTFRVYYHVPTDGTDEVYCIGTEIPCEANLYSANGYTPDCQPDVNECDVSNGGCDQTCTNVVGAAGSYECGCNNGYELSVDQHTCNDINECATNNGDCGQICINSAGTYECGCNAGYLLEIDGSTCSDINECSTNNGGCTDSCSNSAGSYQCGCGSGFQLNADGHSCDDINECATNNGGCAGSCTNSDGSYQCSCGSGYQLNADGHGCDDINECTTNNGGCAGSCTNYVGSYECGCSAGYLLNADGHGCDEINECATNNGGCAGSCTNSAGSYLCSCDSGYLLNADGHGCDEINECATNNGGCTGSCTNSAGSYQCSCGSGFQLNADGHGCDDINECATNNGGCAGSCSNSAGSYECGCSSGYLLSADGHWCDDINECATNNGGCAGSCTNSAGSYQCGCGSGYQLNADGHGCDDINECATNNGGCAGVCANSAGSYLCACASGYQLNADGHRCDEINECVTNNGGCAGSCTNTPGSYQCGCGSGYLLNADGHNCDDIDECATNNGGCAGSCTNSAGSYQCGCGLGHQLNADGHGCDDVNECASSNGGCSDVCENTGGSFNCACNTGRRMLTDGQTCIVEKPVLGGVSISWEVSESSFFRSVVMKCDLESPPTGLLYDITWYVGDKKVNSVEGAAASAFPIQLQEADWNNQDQVQQNLRCEVSARHYADWEPSDPASAEYFVGFTVDETILHVDEGGNPAYYTIRPTIPILCPKGFESCTFPLEIHTPVSSKDKNTPASCSNGDTLEQGALEFLQTPCRVDIPMTKQIDPNTAFHIAVSAAIDNVYDGEHSMVVNVAGPEIYQYHRLLSGAVLPEAEVIISDRDVDLSNSICKARNDPHMTTFDGRVYENQLEGEFILYKHTSLPIEVRGYFKKCNRYATCVCGVAVRSGADLFIYDSCRIFMKQPMRVRMYTCSDESITVKQETSTRYRITLPTGTQVVADRSWIHIQPSVADVGKVEGLCGTLDNDCSNDFQLQNGDSSTHAFAKEAVCDKYKRGIRGNFHPNDFSASWRIDTFHSWYRGVVPESDKEGLEKVVYCSCPSGGKDAVCSNRPSGSASIQNCVVNDHDNNPVKKCISRSKRATNGDDIGEEVGNFEYDPNFVAATPDWPNDGGIAEAAARTHCEDAIKSKQVLKDGHNMGLVNIANSVETCMADILLSGGTAYTHVHIEDPMEDIRREISRNMSLYSYNANTGEVTPPAMLDDICPSDCSSHGTCVNGICECDANYGDSDCSIRTDAIPELYDMPSNGLCDLQHRPCQATPVYGTPFVQSENFKCKITPILLKNGKQVSQDSVVAQAEFDHLNRAMCPFPTLDNGLAEDVTAYAFQVAMTNDGDNYSAPKAVTVYDGRCIECPTGLNGSCVLTPGNCYIDQTCFEASDFNPMDSCKRCDPNYSTHQWAPVYSDKCKSNDNTYIIIGVVLAVAIAGTAAFIAGVVYTIHKKNKKFTQVQDISKVDLTAIDA